MREWVPRTYSDAGYDYTKKFEAGFCAKYNGLMLRAGDTVEKVFCSAFASPDVLRKILNSRTEDAMLFLHHPVDLEVCGQGFLPVPVDVISTFEEKRISIYCCHAPLDCHDRVGTNAAIVEALGMKPEKSFVRYGLGYAGRIGMIEVQRTDLLLKSIRNIFGISRMEVGGCLTTEVRRIAIVAGGGDEIGHLRQAQENACDMYLTGEWYPRYTPKDEDVRSSVARLKEEIASYTKNIKMVLVGVSHAASEFLVMKTQMKEYFESKGLSVEAIPQENWWR
ncbi:MAG: Nif3-like dinuclear metal center hexameric protein [candidate division WOR-3 bacterium]|nr:MAG: Nif3-like dinuclear metal center hexameric protein [candidate division WOR-3 bacterium]